MTSDWAREHPTWTAALLGLRRSVEAIGIMAVINGVVGNNNTRKLDPEEFRGFVLSDSYAPLQSGINRSKVGDSNVAKAASAESELKELIVVQTL